MVIERLNLPPRLCPRCHKTFSTFREADGGKLEPHITGSHWYKYTITPDLPSCGCGNCGYVVFLSKPLPFGIATIEDEVAVKS